MPGKEVQTSFYNYDLYINTPICTFLVDVLRKLWIFQQFKNVKNGHLLWTFSIQGILLDVIFDILIITLDFL